VAVEAPEEDQEAPKESDGLFSKRQQLPKPTADQTASAKETQVRAARAKLRIVRGKRR
jgi:hypothetical protein